jgi:hypothetical protein
MDLRAQRNPNTVIVGDLNTPLSSIDWSSIQAEDQQRNFTVRPNGHIRYLQSISPTTSQYPICSAAHGTFSKIHHILGHKASFNKFKKIEIRPCIISKIS